jgi:hypothetical protein
MRVRLEVRAGVHHHAELGEQKRQRQHMNDPAAVSANQESLRAGQYPSRTRAVQLKPS